MSTQLLTHHHNHHPILNISKTKNLKFLINFKVNGNAYTSLCNAESLRSCFCAKVVVDNSKRALQAEKRTFLLGLSKSEINPLTVSESEAISSLSSRETREAVPMISAAWEAVWERVEARRVGSKARMGVKEDDWERRREGRSLNKHLLMRGRVVVRWLEFERDESNKANMPLTSET